MGGKPRSNPIRTTEEFNDLIFPADAEKRRLEAAEQSTAYGRVMTLDEVIERLKDDR